LSVTLGQFNDWIVVYSGVLLLMYPRLSHLADGQSIAERRSRSFK
jgi:hypothetical protein